MDRIQFPGSADVLIEACFYTGVQLAGRNPGNKSANAILDMIRI